MKKIKLLVGLLVALVFLGAVSAPIVSAQPVSHPLDGKWLKCKVNGKGYKFDPGTDSYSKQNGSLEAYLHFAWNVNHYDVAVWTNPNGKAGPWVLALPLLRLPSREKTLSLSSNWNFRLGRTSNISKHPTLPTSNTIKRAK